MENMGLGLWGTVYAVKYVNIKYHCLAIIEFKISILSEFQRFTSMEISDG